MTFLRHAIRKDLKRAWSDRLALALYLGIPLAIGSLILLLAGGGRPQPVAKLLIADEDDSFVSGLFQTMLESEQASQFLDVERTDRESGREVLDDGDASGLLILPKGFQDAVLLEEPAEMQLITNPSETIKPQILATGLEVVTDGVFYLHRILGDEIRQIADGPTEDEQISTISVSIRGVVRKIEKYVFPPAIEIKAGDPPLPAPTNPSPANATAKPAPKEKKKVSFALLLMPGILFMGLIYMAQGLSLDVWTEKETGTLSRMMSAPSSVSTLLLGKVTADAILIFGIAAFLMWLGMFYLDVPMQHLPLAIAWATISGIVFLLVFMAIAVSARSRRTSMIISNSLMFPLLMVGGSFFPSETMPAWMGTVGRWTPNGWSLGHLKRILTDRAETAGLLSGALGFLSLAVILFFYCQARMRGSFARR